MNSRGWREIAQGPHGIPGRVRLVIRRHPLGLFLRGWLIEYSQKLGSGRHGFRAHPGEQTGGAFSNVRAGTLEAFAEQAVQARGRPSPLSGKASEPGETAVVPVLSRAKRCGTSGLSPSL